MSSEINIWRCFGGAGDADEEICLQSTTTRAKFASEEKLSSDHNVAIFVRTDFHSLDILLRRAGTLLLSRAHSSPSSSPLACILVRHEEDGDSCCVPVYSPCVFVYRIYVLQMPITMHALNNCCVAVNTFLFSCCHCSRTRKWSKILASWHRVTV